MGAFGSYFAYGQYPSIFNQTARRRGRRVRRRRRRSDTERVFHVEPAFAIRVRVRGVGRQERRSLPFFDAARFERRVEVGERQVGDASEADAEDSATFENRTPNFFAALSTSRSKRFAASSQIAAQ